jgi:hypothetical protein
MGSGDFGWEGLAEFAFGSGVRCKKKPDQKRSFFYALLRCDVLLILARFGEKASSSCMLIP